MPFFITRRELLKRAGLAGAAAAIGPPNGFARHASWTLDAVAPQSPAAPRDRFDTLSAAEAEVLEAVVARLIPSDATGPGALEARAAHFIDRALAGALASSRSAYAEGLSALDQYATASRGKRFSELSAADQDAVLIDLETGAATGFAGGSAAFFALVRTHTIQGTFCDPFYGGNANFVGWDLLGYPGVRTVVSPEEQRLGVDLAPNHKSAYDSDMFTKASARADPASEMKHGG